MSCAQRYQLLPPGATLAGLKGSGQDTLPWAPAQGAGVGWGRGALQRTVGACPAFHPFPLLFFQATTPRFSFGGPPLPNSHSMITGICMPLLAARLAPAAAAALSGCAPGSGAAGAQAEAARARRGSAQPSRASASARLPSAGRRRTLPARTRHAVASLSLHFCSA